MKGMTCYLGESETLLLSVIRKWLLQMSDEMTPNLALDSHSENSKDSWGFCTHSPPRFIFEASMSFPSCHLYLCILSSLVVSNRLWDAQTHLNNCFFLSFWPTGSPLDLSSIPTLWRKTAPLDKCAMVSSIPILYITMLSTINSIRRRYDERHRMWIEG
jgi:hypothetical protein